MTRLEELEAAYNTACAIHKQAYITWMGAESMSRGWNAEVSAAADRQHLEAKQAMEAARQALDEYMAGTAAPTPIQQFFQEWDDMMRQFTNSVDRHIALTRETAEEVRGCAERMKQTLLSVEQATAAIEAIPPHVSAETADAAIKMMNTETAARMATGGDHGEA